MKNKLIFTFLVLLLAFTSMAGEKINRESWRELRDGLHYKKKDIGTKDEYYENWSKDIKKRRNRETLNSKPRDKEYLNSKSRKLKKPSGRELNIPQWVIYLVYVMVGIILVLVIYFLFVKQSRRTDKIIIQKSEEELPIEKPFNELEELMAESIKSGDFREAVRIYFIYIIKSLREKGWIEWEKKKTNTAYLFEMRNRNQFSSFSQATLFFEIIWYGNRKIDAEQFQKLRPQFDDLIKSIQSANE